MVRRIKLLQRRTLTAKYAIQEYENAIAQILNKIRRKEGRKSRIKPRKTFVEYVEDKFLGNAGLLTLKDYLENDSETNEVVRMNDRQKSALKNAFTASAESERGFSIHNAFFRPNRYRLNFKTVQQKQVKSCIMRKVCI